MKLELLTNKNRIFGLDILRAIAILFVVFTHAGKFFPPKYIKYYMMFDYDGVGIFFVLSGFLIGNIFIKQVEGKQVTFGEIKFFWIKRWTRTLPNYYFILIILIIFNISQINIRGGILHLIFLQNLLEIPKNNFFGWSWSLSVEEWFYIFFPLAVYLLFSLKFSIKKSIFIYSFIFILTIPIFRFLVYHSKVNFTYENYYSLSHSVFYRLDAIAYGVMAAYLYSYYRKWWNTYKKPLLIVGIILLSLALYFGHFISGYAYKLSELSLTSITVFCFLPYLNSIKYSKSLFYKPITFLSVTSYSLYLVNYTNPNSTFR
ncbi:acyltransferase family protein [Riemerella columbipharyngis]|uniref:Peptidoglycan/LPS O-acetylase OafA/YrhL, contains acyltransferase and SGNH-hydrolase domains n=1 Tax=Riemerella columbipharyngis TaxID=1071918 RepID=A0A1G7CIL4_9FLAO|nr:acyltransferase [Riemerella columbipharyngis]SDE39192.1 Peptidoglycan/LPS O-acetylase OafA/YrhL, contains acyltransferase and SGNH-hydrolase domains [Riemerella columbipharyngis]